MNDEQTPALREAVENMRNMRESYNQLVEQNAQLAADVQAIKDAHILGFSYDGIIFEEGYEPQSSFGIIANRNKILEVHDNRDTELPGMSTSDYPILEVFEMRNAETPFAPNVGNWMQGSRTLRVVILPNIKPNDYTNLFIYNMSVLEFLDFENVKFNSYSSSPISNTPKLIDIITGKTWDSSCTMLANWTPTIALDLSSSLLTQEDLDAGFTSNREKLLYNIREHIAENLPDRTGLSPLTITFSQTMRNAFDETTEQAFAAKNWDIAPARS